MLDDTMKETRSRKPYNMWLACVDNGLALKFFDKVKTGLGGAECDYHAWK